MDNKNLYYSYKNDYDNKTDEDLVAIIKSGDKCALEYLMNRYRELVNIKVSKYYWSRKRWYCPRRINRTV